MPAFRLQALLDYKQQLEDQQAVRLSAAEGERRAAQGVLDDWYAHREEQCRRIDRLALANPLEAHVMREAVAYLGHLDAAIARQVEVVREAEACVAAELNALMGIAKERRALERLRDHQAEKARRETERTDARRTDDLTMTRFGRFATDFAAEGM